MNSLYEHTMLRSEQMSLMSKQDTHTLFAYTIAAAIIAASFTISDAMILNIALLILVPITFRIVRFRNALAHISGYITAHLEDKIDVRWESYNKLFKEKYHSDKNFKLFYYASKSDLLVIVLSLVFLFWYQQKSIAIVPAILIGLFHAAVIAMQIFVIKHYANFDKQQDLETQRWHDLLDEEKSL